MGAAENKYDKMLLLIRGVTDKSSVLKILLLERNVETELLPSVIWGEDATRLWASHARDGLKRVASSP